MTKPKEVAQEQQVYRDLDQRCKDKQKAINEIWESVEDLTRQIVDAKEADRKALVVQRSAEMQEADLLQAEYKILCDRKKVAYLRIYTLALEKAKQDLNELIVERQDLAKGGYVADRSKLRAFQAEIKGIEDRKERDQMAIEFQLNMAENHARAVVNNQNIQRVKNTIRRCEMELAQASAEIEKW